jgi:hypothetical protein
LSDRAQTPSFADMVGGESAPVKDTPAFSRSIEKPVFTQDMPSKDSSFNFKENPGTAINPTPVNTANVTAQPNDIEVNSAVGVYEWALREAQELINVNEAIKYFKKLSHKIDGIASKKGL